MSLPVPIESLIDQIANGAFLKDLVPQVGISKQALSVHLRKHPDYAAAKIASIESQLDAAQEALQTAREPVDITRARELFRAVAWRAEHETTAWSAKQEITGPGGQPLQINNIAITFVQAVPSRSATIEHEAQSVVDTNLD